LGCLGSARIARVGFGLGPKHVQVLALFCNATRFFPLEGSETKIVQPEREKQTTTNPKNQNRNMKTVSLLAAMFLTVALAGPAVAQELASSQDTANNGHHTVKQFNGTLTASESYTDFGQPPILFFVNAGGTANIANLGQFTVVYTFIVDYVINPAIGRARFIAANGDNIFTTSTGVGTPTSDPNVSNVVEMHTITGGTGQFAHAKGEFTVRRVVTFTGPTTGTTTGSIHGFIILRGNHGH
jgi:hypothetical protein